MKFAGALILIGVLTLLVNLTDGWFGTDDASTTAVIFALGTLLLGAWLLGELFHKLNLPHITGYLLFGMLMGPSVFGLILEDQRNQMDFANSLAISLIALTAGGEIRFGWLKSMARRLTILIGVDVLIVLCLCVGGLLLASMVKFGSGEDAFALVPFMAEQPTKVKIVIALLACTVMIANSPAVVIAMLAEYKCKGPLSRTALAMTVLKDMVLVVLFATMLAIAKASLNPDASLDGKFIAGVSVQLFGSIALGAVLGLGMAWYVHKVKQHLLPFVIGCCMLFALIGEQYFVVLDPDAPVHLEALLIALAAGVLMQNVWPKESEPLFHAVEESSLPVYCVFFALAGAKIDVAKFSELWLVGLILLMFTIRAGAIFTGVRVGCKVAGIEGDAIKRLWMAMIPQAGVAIVFVELIDKSFPGGDWSGQVFLLLMGMIILHESLGPILFKRALSKSGEIGAADHEVETDPAEAENESDGAGPSAKPA